VSRVLEKSEPEGVPEPEPLPEEAPPAGGRLRRWLRDLRRHPERRMARLIIGWLLVALGILGLFLPFLQGILFIAMGLGLLAPEYPIIGRAYRRLRSRRKAPKWLPPVAPPEDPADDEA
jgi:hypothetical protein